MGYYNNASLTPDVMPAADEDRRAEPLPDGLRIAHYSEAGWVYKTPTHTLWVTDAPLPAALATVDDSPPSDGPGVPRSFDAGRQDDQLYRKEIVWDRETHDFAMYLDGELVGFTRTYTEAEVTLDQLVLELISGEYFREQHARPAEVVELVYAEPLLLTCASCGVRKPMTSYVNIDQEIVCDACLAQDGQPGGDGGGGGALPTCEQCRIAKPESGFTAVLAAPLGAPCICDACLEKAAPAPSAAPDLAKPASTSLPVEHGGVAKIAAPSPAQSLTHPDYPQDAWRCLAADHVFWVDPGALPLTCPRCDALAQIAAGHATQQHVLGAFLAASYEEAPAAFLAKFDTFHPIVQAAITRAVATFQGEPMGAVDARWLAARLVAS
jgi:hypothetical protein